MGKKFVNLTDKQRDEIYAKHLKGRHYARTMLFRTEKDSEKDSEIKATDEFFAAARKTQESSGSYSAHKASAPPSNPNYNDNPFAEPIHAHPVDESFPSQTAYAFAMPQSRPTEVHHHHHHDRGIPYWWFLLNGNSGSTHYHNYNTAPQQSNGRQNNTRDERQGNSSNFAAYVGILVLAGAVIAPAAGGAFYLLSELCNNFERLWYNEGYLQAGFGFLNIVLSLNFAAILTNAVLSSAITALAVSAGLSNPVGWAFFIMGCVTLFTAACIHLILQEGLYRMTALCNPNALHPEDPGRFCITDAQVNDIRNRHRDDRSLKSLDTNNMQNVITAIHHDLEADPSWVQKLVRHSTFFRDTVQAENLSAIRELRMHGKVDYETTSEENDEVTMRFNNSSLRR